MQQHWLNRDNNKKLILYVLGWGCDYRCVEHIAISKEYDVLTIYDYRTIEALDKELLSGYESVILFAWSFGVWAAERLLEDIKLTHSVAFNGTPKPVDKSFGIDPKRLSITLRGFAKNGTEEFLKRTYGNAYDGMKEIITPRSQEQNIEELTTLYNLSAETYGESITWSKAIVGEEDVIFPPENMIAYWGIRAQILPLPHYPFNDAQIILREIENR